MLAIARHSAFAALALVAAAAVAPAADPADLVVLFHPKMKDWEQKMAGDKLAPHARWWGVYGYRVRGGRTKFTDGRVRVVVGDSVKAVDDWSMLIQFGAPGSTPPPRRGGLLPELAVPFVVRYRKSADDKPVEVARGTVSGSGRNYAAAVEDLCKGRIHAIGQSLRLTEAGRVFADKPTVAPAAGIPSAFAPVKVDLKADPPTATVRLHNKLPVPVDLSLDFQSQFTLPNGGQYFSFPPMRDGNVGTFVLAAGEERTLTIGLKDLRKGHEPRWCKLNAIHLLNPLDELEK